MITPKEENIIEIIKTIIILLLSYAIAILGLLMIKGSLKYLSIIVMAAALYFVYLQYIVSSQKRNIIKNRVDISNNKTVV